MPLISVSVDGKQVSPKTLCPTSKVLSPPNAATQVFYMLPDLKTLSTGNVANVTSHAHLDPITNLTYNTLMINSTSSTPVGEGDCGLPLVDSRTGGIIGFHCVGPSHDNKIPFNGAVAIKPILDARVNKVPHLNGSSPASSQ
jgi:hypothetical protein